LTALAFGRRGRGPPLLLLHPLGADRRMWEPALDRLAAERDVVAVDLPGFGDSPPLDNGATPTPAALAHAIVSGLAGVVDPPFHVAGNSLGGWVALELALTGAARSVTAIAPAGLWPQPLRARRNVARRLARTIRPVAAALTRSERGRRLALAGIVARPDRVPPAAAAHLVAAYAAATGFEAVNTAMRAGTFTGLDALAVPVTLAWPDRDRLVARRRDLPPAVRSVTLHGCGHLPMWDDPEQVAEVLLSGSARDRGGA
jgi:pimeloyl-ACP methyl ester carboxylesterase